MRADTIRPYDILNNILHMKDETGVPVWAPEKVSHMAKQMTARRYYKI